MSAEQGIHVEVPDDKKHNIVGFLGLHIPNTMSKDEIKIKEVMAGNNRIMLFNNILFAFNEDEISWKEYGNYFVICDAQIYNEEEVINVLKKKNYEVKGNNNAELILELYKEFGVEFLAKLDGDFAVCIVDGNKGITYLARDKMGIKPFYYYKNKDNFIFSTTIKNILSAGVRAETNDQMIFDYLFFNLKDHTKATFFKKINQIPPAHFLMVGEKSRKLVEYWVIEDLIIPNGHSPYNSEVAYENLRNDFFNTIKKRTKERNSHAVNFSGGLDSSSIVATLGKICSDTLTTYSCVFEGYNYSKKDTEYIEIMCQNYPIKNRRITVTPNELKSDFGNFIYCLEEPALFDWEYMKYKLMENASRDGAGIIFDGNCADYVFLGAGYHYAVYFLELLKRLKIVKLMSLFKKCKNDEFRPHPIFLMLFFLLPQFIRNEIQRKEYMAGIKKGFYKVAPKNWHSAGYKSANNLITTLLNFNKPNLQCVVSGISKYAQLFSINVRLPYSDVELQRNILNIPLKIQKEHFESCTRKYLLRKIMDGFLIEEVRNRPKKTGMDVPLDNWYRKELKDFVWDIINSETFAKRNYFDSNVVKTKFEKHLKGKINFGSQLWKIINLELWLRTFIDPEFENSTYSVLENQMKNMERSRNLTICLACSIGGHFTQMLELKEVYENYNHFFVTNPGAQTISALANKRKYFIPERIKKSEFLKQLIISLKILLKEKPDVIISTGSGDAFWICLIGKLFGKDIIYIESVSRVTNPSKFGRVIYKFADLFLYQWENLRDYYPKGICGGMIFNISKPINMGDNEYSYFVTTGTLPNDFSRLLKRVDELIGQGIIEGKVFSQIGNAKYVPKNYVFIDFLNLNELEEVVNKSEVVITHGGVGSIMTALKYAKKVIVVPRYKRFDEIRDDHQLDITQELERQGKIIAVYEIYDLGKAIRRAKELKATTFNMEKQDINIKKILQDWLEKKAV